MSHTFFWIALLSTLNANGDATRAGEQLEPSQAGIVAGGDDGQAEPAAAGDELYDPAEDLQAALFGDWTMATGA